MLHRPAAPALALVALLLAGPLASGGGALAFDVVATLPGFHPEPSLWVAPDDQLFVAAPTGLWVDEPKPVIMWRSTPSGFEDISPPPFVLGGGDTDVMMAPNGDLVTVDLSLASVSSWVSSDRGTTWSDPYPLASGTLANDRMWLASDDAGAYYLVYNQLETGYWVAKSTDGGKLWIPSHVAGVGQYPPGPLVHSSRGVLAFPYSTGPAGTIAGLFVGDVHEGPVHAGFAMYVATSKDGGASWTERIVARLPEWGQNLFPAMAADSAGNLYAVWSEGILDANNPIRFSVSTDDGDSWSPPRTLVAANGGANKLPWAVAGAPGRLGVAYYAADRANDQAGAVWRIEYAVTADALSAAPTVERAFVSPDVAYRGAMSGLSARPPVGDFLTVRALSDGRAVLAWAESYQGDRVKVAVQTTGPTLS